MLSFRLAVGQPPRSSLALSFAILPRARGALYTLQPPQPRLFSRGENWLQSTDYFESRSPFLRTSTKAVPRRSYCAIYTYVSCSHLDIRDDGRYDRLQIQASQAILNVVRLCKILE